MEIGVRQYKEFPGYTFYEYLESHGTEYIDTEVNPKISPRVIATLLFLNSEDRDYWGNNNIDGSAFYANFYNYKLAYYRYGSTTASSIGDKVQNTDVFHVFDTSKNVHIDNTYVATMPNTYTYNSSQTNIYIFGAARNSNQISYKSTFRLKHFILYDGESKLRDFYPASNGIEYGLYDIVNNVFYTNLGTGSFTVGDQIDLKIPSTCITKLIKDVYVPIDIVPESIKNTQHYNSELLEWTNTREYVWTYNIVNPINKYGSTKYYLEFDAKVDIDGQLLVYSVDGSDVKYNIGSKYINCTSEWLHYKLQFSPTIIDETSTTRTNTRVSFYGTYDTGRIPHIKNVKLYVAAKVKQIECKHID